MVSDPVDLACVKRALVIKLRHHGDVLLASPVFQVLKNRAPHIEVDALVYADTREMLAGHPAIHAIHCIDREWKKRGLLAQGGHEWALLHALRKRRYDLLIHLTEHPRGAWLARLLGPASAVAMKKDVPFWRASFTHLYPLPSHTPRHTVEANLDALRRLGIYPEETEKRLTLVPGANAEERVAALLSQSGIADKPFIHIHPTSRWFFKTWPAQRFANLIRELGRAGHRVVLTAAPAANERDMIVRIKEALKAPVTDFTGMLSLKELAALTARARLFIGVDSAPMHIAAAMGTPVVALFGPSGEAQWGPWMAPSRVVTSRHACRPCGNDGCGGGKVSECLTTLPEEHVLAAANELLAQG
jgi:heptosyltransferase-3